jgi:hypothetical protein
MNGVPTALTDQAEPAAGQVCCDLLACCLCLALQHQLPYRLAVRHGTSPFSIDRAGSERVDAGFAGGRSKRLRTTSQTGTASSPNWDASLAGRGGDRGL